MLPTILLILILTSILVNLDIAKADIFEYDSGLRDEYQPYVQITPSYLYYSDGKYNNVTIGISQDFTFNKVKPLYLEELSASQITQDELYEYTHWNITVSTEEKDSGGDNGGGGGMICPPGASFCNGLTSNYPGIISGQDDADELYDLYGKHNEYGAPSGTTFLRIATHSSSDYGITSIKLTTIISSIQHFIELNKGKILIIGVAVRLNDTSNENNYINVNLSAKLKYGSTYISNSTQRTIYKDKAWSVLYIRLNIPTNLDNNADDSYLLLCTTITSSNQYIENMKIDFDFINIYLAYYKKYEIVFPLTRTAIIDNLYWYTQGTWYWSPGAVEYENALKSLRDRIFSDILNNRKFVLIPIGVAYVIWLFELPLVDYSDSYAIRLFIPVTTVLVVTTTNASRENYFGQSIEYADIIDSGVVFSDPLSQINVRHSLRLEYPAITSISVRGYRVTIHYNGENYATGVKWGPRSSSGSNGIHAYKTILYYSNASISDYGVSQYIILTAPDSFKELASISASLSAISLIFGIVAAMVFPPAGIAALVITEASIGAGVAGFVMQSIEQSKENIPIWRSISSGDSDNAGDTGYAQATVYISYPSQGEGIDNIMQFAGMEIGAPLQTIEKDYKDVISDMNSNYYLFNVSQFRWFHTYSVPYDLLRDNPSLEQFKFGVENITIRYTAFLSILVHNTDGEQSYLKINSAEKINYYQSDLFKMFGERYGWYS